MENSLSNKEHKNINPLEGIPSNDTPQNNDLKAHIEDNDDEIVIFDILFILLKHWKALILAPILCTSLFYLHYVNTPKSYISTAYITPIDKEDSSVSSGPSNPLEMLFAKKSSGGLSKIMTFFESFKLAENVYDILKFDILEAYFDEKSWDPVSKNWVDPESAP
ncbi:hypothetical protein BVY03_02440 [bacterium K02(2017)]|nr:hypothetical protein BVY03_02440 [bacterium K02(2017)]